MSSVLVLVANYEYINKAFNTILQARTVGKWDKSIVLLVPNEIVEINPSNIAFTEYLYSGRKKMQNAILLSDPSSFTPIESLESMLEKNEEYLKIQINIKNTAEYLGVILKGLPTVDFSRVESLWSKYPTHPNLFYILSRNYQYMKFFIMDPMFKQWDKVIYLDAGVSIQGPLERIVKVCDRDDVLYAHSDTFPTYDTKLDVQFDFTLDNQISESLKNEFNVNRNYFQSTVMVFSTKIITEQTIPQLFTLMNKYPISTRNDQGIFNLHFLCERNLWKQLPIIDEEGFLYDFHEREGRKRSDYVVLKYPRT